MPTLVLLCPHHSSLTTRLKSGRWAGMSRLLRVLRLEPQVHYCQPQRKSYYAFSCVAVSTFVFDTSPKKDSYNHI